MKFPSSIIRSAGLLCAVSSVSVAAEPWSFVVLADWHLAEQYLKPGNREQSAEKDTAFAKRLHKAFGGELIVIPGDTNGGHWYEKKFIADFAPGKTAKEVIPLAAEICYGDFKKAFAAGG